MDLSTFKIDVDRLRAGDREQMKKVAFYGAGIFGLVLLYRWWRGPAIDQSESVGTEVVGIDTSSNSPFNFFTSDYTPAQAAALKSALPERAKQYADLFVAAGRKYGVPPVVLAGLMKTETGYGEVCNAAGRTGIERLPACRGFTKQDFGLMQINAVHKEFFRKTVNGRPAYEDPEASIMYGAAVLRDSMRLMAKRNKTGVVRVPAERARKYGCASSGLLPDGRPAAGMLQLRAGIAGYNAGPGYAIMALACRVDPEVVTHKGRYVTSVLGEANRILASMKAAGVA